MAWVPLSQREQPTDGFSGPFEGIPAWLVAPVRDYLRESIDGDRGVFRLFEAATRQSRPYSDVEHWDKLLMGRVKSRPEYTLDVVDYLLSVSRGGGTTYIRRTLQEALVVGGSVWRVVSSGGTWGLQRVESVDTAEATEQLRPANADVADLLGVARAALYGRKLDPTAAYHRVVQAVEKAMQPVVSPDDQKATLGKMNAVLRDAPEGKFTFALDGNPKGCSGPRESIAPLSSVLLKTQRRHGTDERDPVTHAEAEAAYLAGVALCGWFLNGAVRRTT